MPIFNNAFEELHHDNENQQTEVHNDIDIKRRRCTLSTIYDNNDTNDAVKPYLWLSGHLRQAGILLNLFPTKILLKQCKRLFSPGTKRQCREVSWNEIILKYCANVFHCLRAWGLSSKLGV